MGRQTHHSVEAILEHVIRTRKRLYLKIRISLLKKLSKSVHNTMLRNLQSMMLDVPFVIGGWNITPRMCGLGSIILMVSRRFVNLKTNAPKIGLILRERISQARKKVLKQEAKIRHPGALFIGKPHAARRLILPPSNFFKKYKRQSNGQIPKITPAIRKAIGMERNQKMPDPFAKTQTTGVIMEGSRYDDQEFDTDEDIAEPQVSFLEQARNIRINISKAEPSEVEMDLSLLQKTPSEITLEAADESELREDSSDGHQSDTLSIMEGYTKRKMRSRVETPAKRRDLRKSPSE